jgi:Uma2 family endonuclease
MSQLAGRVTPSAPKNSGSPVPPLQPGDHLTRAEFERRFDASSGLKKAELIEGKVYVAPPVSHGGHSRPHADAITFLGVYRAATPGVSGGDNASLRLDLDNMPQPDGYLLIDRKSGGQAKIDDDDYLTGAPELILEIAASTASYDLHEKLRVYRRNGVREYIVWRTFDRAVDYFILRDGDYQRLASGSDGLFRSEVFPGLWLDTVALIAGNLAAVLQELESGIASSEHAAFVAALQQRAAGAPPTA